VSACIVGLGQTEFSKDARRSETRLAAEAVLAALADAGLTVADVDGLVSYTIDPVEETELVRTLGIPAITWSSRVPYGGGGSQGTVQHAAAAVAYGAARTVVAYRACKTRSGTRYGRADVRPGSFGHGGTTSSQWCLPYGVLTPASWMSLNSTRYMHDYGVTSADFGRAVVQLREYAATNPNALPPVRVTASTVGTSVVGSRASVSWVPGPPPRTSTEPTVPGGGRTTVTPVSRPPPIRSACPTSTPGTSVTCPQSSGHESGVTVGSYSQPLRLKPRNIVAQIPVITVSTAG